MIDFQDSNEIYKFKTNYFRQIINSITNYKIWMFLAFAEHKSKFKRAKFGSFWLIFGSMLTFFMISTVWSLVLKKPFFETFQYISISFIIWYFILRTLSASANSHAAYRGILNNINFSYTTTIFHLVMYNFIHFLYFLPIVIILILFVSSNFIVSFFFFIIGTLILIINLILLSTIISIVTIKYLDSAYLIKAFLGISTLLTPILWEKNMLGDFQKYIYLNPFSMLLDIVRGPIYENYDLISYTFSILIIVLLYAVVHFITKRKGEKYILWL